MKAKRKPQSANSTNPIQGLAIILFILLTALSPALSQQQEEEYRFRIVATTGQVEYDLNGDMGNIVVPPLALPVGTVITTGPNSTALIYFASGVKLFVQPNTQITIERFDMISVGGELVPRIVVSLTTGTITAELENLHPSAEFRVITPQYTSIANDGVHYHSYSDGTGLVAALNGTSQNMLINGTVVPVSSGQAAQIEGLNADDVRHVLDNLEYDELINIQNILTTIEQIESDLANLANEDYTQSEDSIEDAILKDLINPDNVPPADIVTPVVP